MAKSSKDRPPRIFESCALCLQSNELRESHIIPAFAFRWLRSRSLTGHVRHSDNPNLRVQDGAKMPMLCADCEQLISKDENAFSSKLFRPILADDGQVFYQQWLLRFAVSLSWRVLNYCYGRNPESDYTEEQKKAAGDAEAIWRDFLLERRPHPGIFEQHLMIFTPLTGIPPSQLPNNINRYLLGGIEMDIVGGQRSMMTFAKIGRFAFFGFIQTPSGKWTNTKIHVGNGRIKAGQFEAPTSIGDFLISRASGAWNDVHNEMSPKQRQKAQDELKRAIMRDPAAFVSSDHGKAMLADADMFGDDAILYRP